MKVTKTWSGKKSPTNPKKKEQHQDRKTKDILIHRWQEDDWKRQKEIFFAESFGYAVIKKEGVGYVEETEKEFNNNAAK